MESRLFCIVIMTLVLSIPFFGCGSDDSPTSPSGESTGTVVDTLGGTYSFAGDHVSLTFPINAVDSSISITVVGDGSYPADVRYIPGSCFKFSPEGISFNSPVILRMRYSEAGLPQWMHEAGLAIKKVVGNTWQLVGGSSVNLDSNWVTAPILGFSNYGIVSDEDYVLMGDYHITDSASLADFQEYTGIIGTLEIRSDAPANVFLPNLCSVDHDLNIYGPPGVEHNVISVSIPNLQTVVGTLNIDNCDALKSVSLPACSTVGSLHIEKNLSLIDVDGLSSITTVNYVPLHEPGVVYVMSNDSLQSISGLSGITGTVGAVRLVGNIQLTDVASIAGITRTNNVFEITRCNSITSISPLALTYCGSDLIIRSNDLLDSLGGFQNLQTVFGNLWIDMNPVLKDLTGFSSLTSLGGLYIEYNPVLKSLDGIGNFSSLGNTLEVTHNDILEDISALSSLTTVGYHVRIMYSDSLRSLTGLENLTSIGEDLTLDYLTHLQNLDALSQLDHAYGHLRIYANSRLESITGIHGLSPAPTGGGYVHESLFIVNNSMQGAGLGDAAAQAYLTSIGGPTRIQGAITIEGN